MRERKSAWRNGADPWLSKREAAAYTSRSERSIERAVARGDLEAGGTPGKRAFKRSALDAWLASSVVMLIYLLIVLMLVLSDVSIDAIGQVVI